MLTDKKLKSDLLFVSNMVCHCCLKLICYELKNINVDVISIQLGRIEIKYNESETDLNNIEKVLNDNGFKIITDRELKLLEQIKIAVIELIHYYNNSNSILRNSDYLVEKLGISYAQMAKIFSKYEQTTLEKFIIAHKIEKVKQLIEEGELTLSEIAFMMGYSSTQYLSTQFKTIVGCTFSEFKSNPNQYKKDLHGI